MASRRRRRSRTARHRVRIARASRCGCSRPAHRRGAPRPRRARCPPRGIAPAARWDPRGRGRVDQVHESVRRERRVQGEPEDPAFVAREDVGDGQGRLGQQRAVLQDAHAAGTLAHEEPAVGCEREGPGDLQPVATTSTPTRTPSAVVKVSTGAGPPGGGDESEARWAAEPATHTRRAATPGRPRQVCSRRACSILDRERDDRLAAGHAGQDLTAAEASMQCAAPTVEVRHAEARRARDRSTMYPCAMPDPSMCDDLC